MYFRTGYRGEKPNRDRTESCTCIQRGGNDVIILRDISMFSRYGEMEDLLLTTKQSFFSFYSIGNMRRPGPNFHN
jgi:hypothetical protein